MANPFAAFADAITKAMVFVGNDLNNSQFGPNWRDKLLAERSNARTTVQKNELETAHGRLTLADQLAKLIGSSATGEADRSGDIQRTQPPLILGGEDGGRGYAANVPMRDTMTPDPGAVVPPAMAALTGFDPAVLARIGLGMAANDKRHLQELRGDQGMAALGLRGDQAAAAAARHDAFTRSLEEFKQSGRLDVTRLSGQLRQQLAAYNQNRQDNRFDRGLSSSEDRFYASLNQSEQHWGASQDLHELTARRQVLATELHHDAGLSPEGRAQVIFELGIINGRLANMGLPTSSAPAQAMPAAPGGPRQTQSSHAPTPRPTSTGVVPVSGLDEAMQLPDGTVFTYNGRRFRKQGSTAVPIP